MSFRHPIQYQSDSSQHRPHASERLFSSACDLYSDRCSRLSGHRADMLLFIKHNHCHHHQFRDFSWSLLCYTLVSVLVLGIGIARGQYYWVLDIGCLSWYRSNPTINYIYTVLLERSGYSPLLSFLLAAADLTVIFTLTTQSFCITKRLQAMCN